MIKRTETEWLTLFEQHKASNLSAAAFCKQHNLCPRYFSLRRKQLLSTPGETRSKSKHSNKIKIPRFIQAIPTAQSSTQVRILAGELRLELTGYSPSHIAELVRALI